MSRPHDSRSLSVIVAGTPDFAAESLAALLVSRPRVIAVSTQPDRPSGRGRTPTPRPVNARALEQDLPVYQPESLTDPET